MKVNGSYFLVNKKSEQRTSIYSPQTSAQWHSNYLARRSTNSKICHRSQSDFNIKMVISIPISQQKGSFHIRNDAIVNKVMNNFECTRQTILFHAASINRELSTVV